ncbi:HAD family phosphatase [Blastococcus sp. Marseille-P5729]|uniref:HAD family hydrolase n=1 Tax=Blastococcus sp. Marseille-P5729 TaxID=2086582 RepID=UPI000D10F41F|nr:HAD-IB family hydrolase [Blastococcus sp. Marseille-P5729]
MLVPFLSKKSPAEARARAKAAGTAAAAAAEVAPSAEIPVDPKAAAFFDVDNTMMVGASIFHFAKGLATRKFFTTGDLASMVYQQAKFRLIGSENTDDIHASRDRALAFVKDVEVETIRRLGEEIYDEEMAQKIYSGTRALAQMHLDAGQRVWLVTATPVELATVIADRLGLTGAIGTVAEQIDGRYTGRLVGEMMHGTAKAEAITAIAARDGLDLSRCTAYSDSINDLPMLTLVGHAVAVNPDPDLRREAIERGWEIRDYRTGRKAVMIGALLTVSAAASAALAVAALAAWRAIQRRQARAIMPPGPADRLRRRFDLAAEAVRTAAIEYARAPGR